MINQTDDYWRQKLTPEQYAIVRKHGTEPRFSGIYNDHKAQGMYRCIGCESPLFKSDAKFDSDTGWPSFNNTANADSVTLHEDKTFGMDRTEVRCANCGAHLGHVFSGGSFTKNSQHFCINSLALDFSNETNQPDPT